MLPSNRRNWLKGLGAAAVGAGLPGVLFARAATDTRFVFIIQRGAADGLHTVVPYADPGYARLRGALAVPTEQLLRLDGLFGLHPSLAEVGRLHAAGEALFVHAVASPYRERSHFDAQNVLESGGTTPHQQRDGWMNRLLGLLPRDGQDAIALAPTVPLALRGPVDVSSYAPSAGAPAADDLLQRVQQMYQGDPLLQPLWQSAMQARGMAGEGNRRADAATLGKLAATFLSQPQGPRLAMLETTGWDTHSAQAPRLAARLRDLDAMVASLREGLGPLWARTVVLVATEFGRTAAANGTAGTDHGTAGVALVLGGAVQGGRVMSDWPGLVPAALQDGRDLRPTLRLDALVAGLAAEAFALEPGRVARTLYPALGQQVPMDGLVRSAAG